MDAAHSSGPHPPSPSTDTNGSRTRHTTLHSAALTARNTGSRDSPLPHRAVLCSVMFSLSTCCFGQSEPVLVAGEDEPPDDDDEGDEDDEQRNEEDDEGGQGDDDADEDEGDESNDEKRGGAQMQQTRQTMQAAQQQPQRPDNSSVDDVADELMALSLSSQRSRAGYTASIVARTSHSVDDDSFPSSAEKESDGQRGEHKQLLVAHVTSRSSSTPPLLFIAAATTTADSDTLPRQPYRRHSIDSSASHLTRSTQRAISRQLQHDGFFYSSNEVSAPHRRDSHSGTESGGSGSKNSQQSSASTGLSSSSSSTASSSSSSAASSSPTSLTHTPTRTLPAATRRSLATTAQRTATEGARRQKRRASSQDATAAEAGEAAVAIQAQPAAALDTAAQPHKAPSTSLASLPASSTSTAVLTVTAASKSRSARQLQLDSAVAELDTAEAKGRGPQEQYTSQ